MRHALSLSYREISEALGVGKIAAGEIVRRAEVVGLTWPLPEVLDDGELERRLAESAQGLITQYEVLKGNPSDDVHVTPSLRRHKQAFWSGSGIVWLGYRGVKC